jgi:death on curing protein
MTLTGAVIVAEVVTGIDASTLSRSSRIDLLDSALHAPQAGSGDEDFYPSLIEKAAILVVRVARTHPLPDGNKRLAWQALTLFLALNGHRLEVPTDEAVQLVVGIAAGDHDEKAVMAWLGGRKPIEVEADHGAEPSTGFEEGDARGVGSWLEECQLLDHLGLRDQPHLVLPGQLTDPAGDRLYLDALLGHGKLHRAQRIPTFVAGVLQVLGVRKAVRPTCAPEGFARCWIRRSYFRLG